MSRLTFRHGFSSNPVTDLIRTRRQPIQGKFIFNTIRNYLIILTNKGSLTYLTTEINSKDDVRNAEQIELIDLFGNVLVKENIQPNDLHPTFYSTLQKFQPPANSFFFYIRVTSFLLLLILY